LFASVKNAEAGCFVASAPRNGRGIATINTFVMLGVACMQTLSGIIVDAFEPLADGARSETAYRALFAVLTLVLTAAIAIYSRSRDVRPSDEMREREQQRAARASYAPLSLYPFHDAHGDFPVSDLNQVVRTPPTLLVQVEIAVPACGSLGEAIAMCLALP
jgi:hypothetical protein